MNFTFYGVLFCVLLSVAVQARPQNWRFPTEELQQTPGRRPSRNPQNPFFPNTSQAPAQSTTTARPTATTASPQFLACMRSCPTTMEYNPVCGTNGENYHNNQRLQCAVFCGQPVAVVRLGTCLPL